MRCSELIETVDTHTSGEPTRIILSGIPRLYGASVREMRDYFKEHYDYIRTRLTYEPRGHAGMLCAAVVPPCRPEADFGIFYFDDVQYLDMCGHATIGVGTALAEIGLVPPEKRERYVLETPAGLVTIRNHYADGAVESTSIENVHSYVIDPDMAITVDGVDVHVQVAYGGNVFAILPADPFGLKLVPECCGEMKRLSRLVRAACDERLAANGLPETKITLVQWYHAPLGPDADTRCVHSSGHGSPDRSPGGTGTSAKLAVLHQQGRLEVGEPFAQESIVSGKFVGRILEVLEEDGHTVIVPEITGQARITGFHKFVFDACDPLVEGFFFAE